MSKKAKGGNGNMLLLAGLGVGAFMLFANKSKAETTTNLPETASSSGEDIPDAPKILAVNTSSTESPLPTALVSDEEGMEATGAGSSTSYQSNATPSPTSTYSSNSFDDDDDSDRTVVAASAVANAGAALVKQAQNTGKMPSIVSTKLTPKEQAVVNAGKLTAELALKRPDLYKAAYIKKHGGATQTGKRKALTAATLAIDAAVNAVQANKSGGLVQATKYPAKAQHTFVQTAGGLMAQTALSKIAMAQKAGVKVSPAAQKVAAQVKAAKSKKPKPAAKKVRPAKPRVKAKPAMKARVARPAVKKKQTKKR